MLASTAVTNPDQLIVSSIPCFNQERSNFNLQQTTYLLTVMDKNCATLWKDAPKWEAKMKAKLECIFRLLKIILYTRCSIWKKSERYGCCTETVHIWLNVVKAKMCLRGIRSLLYTISIYSQTFSQYILKVFQYKYSILQKKVLNHQYFNTFENKKVLKIPIHQYF